MSEFGLPNLFKAVDKETGEVLGTSEFGKISPGHLELKFPIGFCNALTDIAIYQSTGLEGKDGEYIFFGDMVVDAVGHVFQVVFHYGSIKFEARRPRTLNRVGKPMKHPFFNFSSGQLTVIGNSHNSDHELASALYRINEEWALI